MNHKQAPGPLGAADIPPIWRDALAAQLTNSENVCALLEVDLDAHMRFVPSVLVATEKRLISLASAGAQSWDYQAGLRLEHHDHAGVGHLQLQDPHGQLAHWRFTLGHNLNALRLVDQFNAHHNSALSGVPVPVPALALCPSCKAPLDPEAEECPVCTKVVHTPPSTWTLLRLWRFARPYRGQLLWGFVLMLLGTAASQVPPYLTIPLVDEVLIPLQNGSTSSARKLPGIWAAC